MSMVFGLFTESYTAPVFVFSSKPPLILLVQLPALSTLSTQKAAHTGSLQGGWTKQPLKVSTPNQSMIL